MPFGFGKKREQPGAKTFRLAASEIRPIAEGHGACLATDRITVDGDPVGYMYREAPDFDGDSGWRFFAGTESQAYVDDPANSSPYDVNTIANYDPEIVRFLGAPVGTVLVRAAPGSPLAPEPGAPAIAEFERQRLTTEWSIELPVGFQRRVVDGSLQLVNPGPPVRTVWIDIWNLPPSASAAEMLDEFRSAPRPHDAATFDEAGADPTEHRFAAWYREVVEGREQWSLNAYTFRPHAYVYAAFIGSENDPDWALRAWRSLEAAGPSS